jgi:hypothetical protein
MFKDTKTKPETRSSTKEEAAAKKKEREYWREVRRMDKETTALLNRKAHLLIAPLVEISEGVTRERRKRAAISSLAVEKPNGSSKK